MKRKDLKALVLLGFATGALTQPINMVDATDTKVEANQQTMTADQLVKALSPEGKKIYNGLNDEGKKAALEMANQSCAGHNACKGKNSCAGNGHSCAGEGSCKGTSKCAFKDKDLAVKTAAKMSAKRQGAAN